MFTSNEIRNIEFEEVKRGYNQTDVKAFLRKISEQIEEFEQEKARSQSEMAALAGEKAAAEQKMIILADKIDDYRKDEDSIRAALLSAQRLSDTIIKEANENAEIILNDARRKSEELFGNTTEMIQKEKDTLEKLKGEVSKFKSTVLNVYKSHLEVLSMIPEADEKDAKTDSDIVTPEPVIERSSPVAPEAEVPAPIIFKSSEQPEDRQLSTTLDISNASPSAVPEHSGESIIDNTFYAPPADNNMTEKDAFASFTLSPDPQADGFIGNSDERPTEYQSQNESFSSEPASDNEEPSRFGQLDFGDGFSFTAK